MAGGEPLLRQDLKEILVWLKGKTELVWVGLLTNATLISQDNISWLKELVDGFNIGLEGASEEINDLIRGEKSFRNALKGISILVRCGAQVTIRMTYFPEFHQEKDVEDLMKFLPEIGVRSFNFRYIVPVGRAENSNRIDREQYKRLCERIWALGSELNLEIGFSDPFPELLINEVRKREIEEDKGLKVGEAVTGCSMGFSLLYIDPQGIVKACPYFPLECGDARTTSLEEIWFKSKTLEKIRWMRGCLRGKCGQCEYKFACGGCRGAAWAHGDFLGADPRCWKAIKMP